MQGVRIEPVGSGCADDVEHVLGGGGDGGSCQCQWWTLTNARYAAIDRDERSALLREQIGATPAPALIARVAGEAVGWVRVGPRTTQPRLARTRDIAAGSREPWDDPEVWAVSCFVVRPAHRRSGLTADLLEAAVAYARDNGARVVEGYPLDPAAGRLRMNQLFRGVLSVFEDAGFRVVTRPKPDRAVVALLLH